MTDGPDPVRQHRAGALPRTDTHGDRHASLAIDCTVQLARCLRDLPDVPTAFAAYERLRRDRVERVAARAARINRTKAPGPVARAIMPALMPLFVRAAMDPEKTVGVEQRYVIDWDAPVTVG